MDLWNKQTAWPAAMANSAPDGIRVSRKEKLKKIFIERDKYFIKYYTYKVLSKIASGRLRKRALARKVYYKHMILGKM